MLSPLRFIVRKMANHYIPIYLAKRKCSFSKERIDNLIVSFTSFPPRIDKVWMVVECLKRQTILPEKIILWLSKEQFPTKDSIPQSLWNRIDDLFEIHMVDEDLKSHKKYYYAVQKNPEKYIFLIDDDIFYPTNMLKEVWDAHLRCPDAIICRYGYQMKYDNNHTLYKYNDWRLLWHVYRGKDVFLGSGGGTLIHKQMMYGDICDKNLFLVMCPTADDVWLNAMAKIKETDIIKISEGMICPILVENDVKLNRDNQLGDQNDIQIKCVILYYREKLGINLL